MEVQTLIKVKYSGALDQSLSYAEIGFQTIAVLVAGLILWRGSSYYFQKKQQQRSSQQKFKTAYGEAWRKKLK